MYRLAQLGFSQSYTYFTWRNSAWEMRRYLEELNGWPVKNFFRANLWPNTPDILHETLQKGGRPAFMLRALLASTLAGSWGIYGPAFELLEHQPAKPGSEEYLDSEKYEIKRWDLNRSDSLRDVMTLLNGIRRAHAALQRDRPLTFHNTDNDRLLCYSKRADWSGVDDTIIVVANFNTAGREAGWIDLNLAALGIAPDQEYEVRDVFAGGSFRWRGARNYVELDPAVTPGHVLEVRRP
jgi:starch synthase (maltosyl-transferring)